MRGTVLIVDERTARVTERGDRLLLDGWEVQATARPDRALAATADSDVIIVGLPGQAATGFIRALRQAPEQHPIPVIAAADGESEIIAALAAGADSTIPGDASPSLVSTAVAAATRRGAVPEPEVVRIGAVEIDRAAREVRVDGQPLGFTRTETQMLFAFAERPRRVMTRDELSQTVWGAPDLRTTRTMDTHMSRITKKFRAAGAGAVVENVWGVGWRLENANNYDRGVSP